MKKGDYYIHLMDALEVVHTENVLILNYLGKSIGANEKDIDDLTVDFLKRFENIRRTWK